MQGNNGQQGSGQKQGGLSWTQSPSANTNSHSQNTGGAKPISQVPPPVASKPAAVNSNTSSNQNNNTKKMGSDNKNNNGARSGGGKTFGIFAAGIIVGLIVGWGWFSLRTDDKIANNSGVATTTATNTNTGSTSGNTAVTAPAGGTTQGASTGTSSSGSLTLTSPQAAGLSATVSDIAVGVPTWVVVYDNVGGKPGNVLGARMFFPGDKSGTVTLLRATNAGQTYFAGEYVDNGDHNFSKQSDTIVTSITGSPLQAQFTTK